MLIPENIYILEFDEFRAELTGQAILEKLQKEFEIDKRIIDGPKG